MDKTKIYMSSLNQISTIKNYYLQDSIYTKIQYYNNIIMELIVDIIPLVKGKISVVTGNLFQATTEY